jgi:hypothetical protein
MRRICNVQKWTHRGTHNLRPHNDDDDDDDDNDNDNDNDNDCNNSFGK